jgi:hypothetical protein
MVLYMCMWECECFYQPTLISECRLVPASFNGRWNFCTLLIFYVKGYFLSNKILQMMNGIWDVCIHSWMILKRNRENVQSCNLKWTLFFSRQFAAIGWWLNGSQESETVQFNQNKAVHYPHDVLWELKNYFYKLFSILNKLKSSLIRWIQLKRIIVDTVLRKNETSNNFVFALYFFINN